ncbi:MAG: acyltransferase [Marinilabiliales bacterium]|nr:MAG: acyltransferase [Marinilabiliales bacterium]
MKETEYDLIRPYNQEEIPEAIERIISDPLFQKLLNYLFPDEEHKKLTETILQLKSRFEFQKIFMYRVIQSIVQKTSDDLIFSDFKYLEKDKGYVFIANHRDIILDSSLLAMGLMENGLKTSEITWGDNLMISPFIVDVGKVNGMITVFREGSPKEMLKNSQRLSSYIRNNITELKQSVWIAQRKGRSKNGSDTTDVSVLKMLSLSGESKPPDSLKELNITPVTISYEWEPCDILKVRELYISKQTTYIKNKDEDLFSIIGGVVSDKGRIQITMGENINQSLHTIDTSVHNNLIIEQIAKLIDQQIHRNYHLWPSNYLAFDMLENSNKYSDEYDETTKNKFNLKLQDLFKSVDGPEDELKSLFLKLYANPVYNKGL